AHVPTVGSGSIPVNASDSINSEPRIRSMPFSITPVPFECWPKVACTRPLSFRADAIPTMLLLDFKLLRKSRSVLPRSMGSLDPHMTADSRLRISGSALMLSESDKDNGALDRHRLDRKPCSPLPFGAPRDNADADAKARSVASRSELQVWSLLLPDLAASFHHRPRTVVALQAIPLCLPPQMHLATVAMRVSRWSTPKPDRKRANRSDVRCPSSTLRLPADARRLKQSCVRRRVLRCARDRIR